MTGSKQLKYPIQKKTCLSSRQLLSQPSKFSVCFFFGTLGKAFMAGGVCHKSEKLWKNALNWVDERALIIDANVVPGWNCRNRMELGGSSADLSACTLADITSLNLYTCRKQSGSYQENGCTHPTTKVYHYTKQLHHTHTLCIYLPWHTLFLPHKPFSYLNKCLLCS